MVTICHTIAAISIHSKERKNVLSIFGRNSEIYAGDSIMRSCQILKGLAFLISAGSVEIRKGIVRVPIPGYKETLTKDPEIDIQNIAPGPNNQNPTIHKQSEPVHLINLLITAGSN